MGNESSSLVDEDTPTVTLEHRDLKSVARLIKDGRVKRVVVMTGAGISTAAGIPDFRSPKTGLYHNLARLNLPFAEAVFEIDYFKENPTPFYVLAKELYPGKFHPTIAHTFIALLARKKLLRMLFTQNIDCLERRAGVPGDLIVEAHGSFATQRCVECKTEYPDKEMFEHVQEGKAPRCIAGCGGLVKPDIVFFGEQLPSVFYDNRSVPAMADLVLVLGTSLTVHPFAGLPTMAMERTPRVLFNKERVGDMGTRPDDVICLSDCDTGVRDLARELGWEDELESMWRDLVGEEEAEKQIAQGQQPSEEHADEVELLADQVEDKLELTDQHEAGVGANEAAQVDDQEETSGSTEGNEKRKEGGTTESNPTAESKSSTSDPTTSSGEHFHQESHIAIAQAGTKDAGPTVSYGVDGTFRDEEDHEPASYGKPVVRDIESEKTVEESKDGGTLI